MYFTASCCYLVHAVQKQQLLPRSSRHSANPTFDVTVKEIVDKALLNKRYEAKLVDKMSKGKATRRSLAPTVCKYASKLSPRCWWRVDQEDLPAAYSFLSVFSRPWSYFHETCSAQNAFYDATTLMRAYRHSLRHLLWTMQLPSN